MISTSFSSLYLFIKIGYLVPCFSLIIRRALPVVVSAEKLARNVEMGGKFMHSV